jgi:hypothetical protein
MNYFGVIFLSIIVEGIITYIKEFFVNGKFQWQMLISIVVGVLVAAAYHVDLLALSGMQTPVPYLGSILTGILISRGSNYIFDLIKALGTAQTKTV